MDHATLPRPSSRPIAGHGARGSAPVPLLLMLVAALAVLPFLFVRSPTMVDLLGHIGRYHVMIDAGRSAYLQAYYAFHWRVVGNLGGEIIAWLTGPWLGAERSGWLIAVAIPLATLAGIAAVSRALHGRIQPAALVAACFVTGNPFHFGFVNYCLSAAVALRVFALWVRTADRAVGFRLLLLTPLVLVTWVTHAMGWGVLALIVAGFEGYRWWRARSPTALGETLVMALAFVPPLVLTLAWRSTGGGVLFHYGADLPIRKLMGWVTILRGGSPVLDIGAPMVLALMVVWLLYRRALAIDWRMASGGVLVALACTLMPATVFGSWAADERLAPMAAIALALSLRSTGTPAQARLLAWTAVALFAARSAETTLRWHGEEARRESALAALAHVEPGARIHAVVLVDGCHAGWTTNGWKHLPSLAIPRREALVNTQWPLAGAPLLQVVYPLPLALRYDPSQQVPAFGCGAPDLTALHRRIASLPRAKLDYLWVLDTHAMGGLWPGHVPLYADANSALFRLH